MPKQQLCIRHRCPQRLGSSFPTKSPTLMTGPVGAHPEHPHWNSHSGVPYQSHKGLFTEMVWSLNVKSVVDRLKGHYNSVPKMPLFSCCPWTSKENLLSIPTSPLCHFFFSFWIAKTQEMHQAEVWSCNRRVIPLNLISLIRPSQLKAPTVFFATAADCCQHLVAWVSFMIVESVFPFHAPPASQLLKVSNGHWWWAWRSYLVPLQLGCFPICIQITLGMQAVGHISSLQSWPAKSDVYCQAGCGPVSAEHPTRCAWISGFPL